MSSKDVNIQFDASTSGRLAAASARSETKDGEFATLPIANVTPADVQAVRLLLGDGSVVDWRRLFYSQRDEVVRFLEVNGYRLDNPSEMKRLQELHARAVEFVESTFDIEIPPRVRRPVDIAQLFLLASRGRRWEQRAACVVLKMMHVVNHLEAKKLSYHLSVSERALFAAAREKVDACIEAMRAEGLGIARYEPSRKTEHSLLTKLISKPQVTAAQIFDKLRFRLTLCSRRDIVPVLQWLTRHLFPYNHVVAGETHNRILSEDEVFQALEDQLTEQLPSWKDLTELDPVPFNPATSRLFNMVSFVVELPVRIEKLCDPETQKSFSHLGHLVLVTLEFQVFDEETAEMNRLGEANHDAYKTRQLSVVAQRLWGRPAPPIRPVLDGADD
jgi:uncharacterized protein (TIGR04552 family)